MLDPLCIVGGVCLLGCLMQARLNAVLSANFERILRAEAQSFGSSNIWDVVARGDTRSALKDKLISSTLEYPIR